MASDAAPDAVAGKRASLSDKLKDGFGNHVTKIATVQFMLCALQSMARADVYVVAVGMGLYAVRENDLLAINLYMGFTVLSVPFDIAWLSTHSDVAFWGVSEAVQGINSFVLAMCIIALILKFPILYLAHQFKSSIALSHPGAKSLLDQPAWQVVTLFSCFICYFGSFFQGLARVDPFTFVLLFAIYAIREKDVKALDMFWIFTVWCIILDITWVGVNTETAQVGTAEAQSRVQALRTEYIFVVCFAILLMMFKVFFLLWVPCIRSKLTTPSTEDSDASLPLSAQDGESALSNAAPRKKMPFSNSDEAKWAHASYGMLITSTIVCILSLASTSDYRADLYPIALVGGFYVVHERDTSSAAKFIVAIIMFLLLDLFWLIFHSRFTSFASVTGGAVTAEYVYGMTVIGFVLKMGTFYAVLSLKKVYTSVAKDEEAAKESINAADAARAAGGSGGSGGSNVLSFEPQGQDTETVNPTPMIAEPHTPSKPLEASGDQAAHGEDEDEDALHE